MHTEYIALLCRQTQASRLKKHLSKLAVRQSGGEQTTEAGSRGDASGGELRATLTYLAVAVCTLQTVQTVKDCDTFYHLISRLQDAEAI